MPSYAVSIVGPDGLGIIAAVTGVLADLDGNIEDSSMTLLRGHFAMTLIVSVPTDQKRLESALDEVTRPRGILASVREVTADHSETVDGSHHLLRVHGGDRPGIVSALTGVVAGHGGNITDLTTRLAGDLYVVVAEFDLPASGDLVDLDRDLATTAAALGVEVSRQLSDPELL